MQKIILSLLILHSYIYAITLDEIIKISLSKSLSLEVIEARIQANKNIVAISNQFSNPEMLLTTNTLDTSQAMSQTVLTLKQKISYYGKRDADEKVAIAQEALLQQKLQNAKITLVQMIKNEAYTIWELEELYRITQEYIKLTKRNIVLYESYTSISNSEHIGIMKAELSLSELKIKKNVIKAKIYSSYAKLSYLGATDIQNLEIDLQIKTKPNLQKLQNSLRSNPQIMLKEKEIQKQNTKLEVAILKSYPDIKIIAGYSHREKFDDYFNIGFGFTLPIYGTEDYKQEEARSLVLGAKSLKEDVKISVKTRLKIYYYQMLSSYEIYHIVQDEALPKLSHMFDITNSSISTGSEILGSIDLLFSKLKLEIKSVNAVSNYYRIEAKISQLRGDIK